MQQLSLFLMTVLLSFSAVNHAQELNYETTTFQIKRSNVVDPSNVSEPDFQAQLIHREAPKPDGNTMKAYLRHQKALSNALYPRQQAAAASKKRITNPVIRGMDYGLERIAPNGNTFRLYGGLPNDNALAISNDGVVLTAMNSLVHAYNIDSDSVVLEKGYLSLKLMAGYQGASSDHFFDPKLIYDEQADRFILVFLKNNTPSSNTIVLAFSSSTNVSDDWYVYELPGNPLNNNRWTDFPTVSLSGEEVFVSGNLIVPGEPWQTGFDGSVIWQIDKNDGYSNENELSTKLHSNITYNGTYIRNLHLVRGANGVADRQFALSNRNFDLANDTIFLLEIEGALSNGDPTLNIQLGTSDLNYGVPPNGIQFNTDTSDAGSGLQTNDARVLGAILFDDQIQFVSNTKHHPTGAAAIYHGIIKKFEQPEVTGHIISSNLDYGYPNIAWSGNEDCDRETIIAFNHTSRDVFPGISCVYYSNTGEYSEPQILKEGTGYIDRINDNGYERWGDYFGLQRRFNKTNYLYSFGYYGDETNRNSGWVNELISPDSSIFDLSFEWLEHTTSCDQQVEIQPIGGLAPYVFEWEGFPFNTDETSPLLCPEDTVYLTVTDQRACVQKRQFVGQALVISEPTLAPNPATDYFSLFFELDAPQQIEVGLHDMSGRLMHRLLTKLAKKGSNEVQFSTSPLSSGVYYLKVYDAKGKELLSEKLVKI